MPSTPVAGAGRPTRDAAERLSARIIEAAHAEFLAKGIEGASIEGIAAAAGCSKLTLYRRFGSRAGLFMALVRASTPDYSERFKVNVSEQPEKVLYCLGQGIAAFFFKQNNLKFIRMVVAEMSRVEGLAELMRDEGARFREPVRACLEELKRRGTGKFEDSTLAAIQFINLCVLGHYYLLAGYTEDQVSPEQQEKLVRSAVALFVAIHFPGAEGRTEPGSGPG
jgi:AcrR family transcriptional regulator